MTKRRSYWDRARVPGHALFHDAELQRAYWETWAFFATLRAVRYVEAVYLSAGSPNGRRHRVTPGNPGSIPGPAARQRAVRA